MKSQLEAPVVDQRWSRWIQSLGWVQKQVKWVQCEAQWVHLWVQVGAIPNRVGASSCMGAHAFVLIVGEDNKAPGHGELLPISWTEKSVTY
ncbi:Uncharacterised protein [Corynebacterium diphtheriae]|nr:Uncharacterised protein [Corynebacterium diphtheriae]